MGFLKHGSSSLRRKSCLLFLAATFFSMSGMSVIGQTPENKKKQADDLFESAVNTLQRPQSLDDVKQARINLAKSLEIYRSLKNAGKEITVLRLLGAAFSMEGSPDEARRSWEEALELARARNDLAEQTANLTNLASYYSDIGDNFTSLKLGEEALVIARQLDVTKTPRALDIIGIILGNLAAGFVETGEFQKAIEYSIEAREITQQSKDKDGEATVLVNLGAAYINKGLYSDAADILDVALKLTQDPQSHNPATEAKVLNNLALLDFFLGRYEEAISYWTRSLKVAEPVSNMGFLGKAKGNIGVALRALGRPREAEPALEEALNIARKAEPRDLRSEVYWLGNLAGLYTELNNYQKSLQYYKQAIAMARDSGDLQAQGRFSHGLGVTYLKQNRLQEASENFNGALRIAKTSNDPTLEWNAHYGLALVQRKLKKFTLSQASFERALRVLETLRGSVQRDAYKTSMLEDKQAFFYDFVDLLLQEEKYERAFEICEAARARAFVDLIASGSSEASDPIRRRLKPLESLEERKAALNTSLSTVKEQKVRAEIENARAGNTKTLEEFIGSLDPELKSLVTVPAVKIGEVKKLAKRKRATILSYFVMPEKLLIWVIRADGKFFPPKQVAINSTQLQEEINSTRGDISNVSNEPEMLRNKLRSLCKTLIDPVEHLLPRHPEALVLVVPHRGLLTLPLAPLIDIGGHYLIEKHTFIYTPSVQLYKFLDSRPRNTTGSPCSAVLVGNPHYAAELNLATLPGAQEEVDEIGKILNQSDCHVAPPLVGNAANEINVRNALTTRISIAHFATHGLFIENAPLKSAIVLTSPSNLQTKTPAEDGFLTVGESFGLNLRAELLVLSSCESGRGEVTADGVMGFSRGFIYGGADSIMVSLWKVNDAATKEEMVAFYRQYMRGRDKAQALRLAELHMIQELRAKQIKSYGTSRTLDEHPGHWSAFVLFGNPR